MMFETRIRLFFDTSARPVLLLKLRNYSFAPSFFAFSMKVAATFLREILPVAPFGIVSTTQTLMGTLN